MKGKTMAVQDELNRVLAELNKATGMTLTLTDVDAVESDDVLQKLKQLTSAYRERYNIDYFLRNLLLGQVETKDLASPLKQFHIESEAKRCLFLIESKGAFDSAIPEILKNLLSSRNKSYVLTMNPRTIAVIRSCKVDETDEDMLQIGHTIVDTLNMEAMTSVSVSVSGTTHDITDLTELYEESMLALRIRRLFYSDRNVIFSGELGVGRLICGLPEGTCRSFLREIFGEPVPITWDSELTETALRFFQHNLNIAETSRFLHMHRNTLIYRLETIERQTGLDIRGFEDAMTFKLALMIFNYLNSERNHTYE